MKNLIHRLLVAAAIGTFACSAHTQTSQSQGPVQANQPLDRALAQSHRNAAGILDQAEKQARPAGTMPKGVQRGNPAMPSSEALRRAMPQQGASAARAMEQAQQRAFNNPTLPGGGSGFAIGSMPVGPGGGVDVEKLASMYGSVERPPDDEAPQVIVFVSLSMPAEALKRIGTQARRAGAVVAVRGLLYGFAGGGWDKSLKALKPLADTGADVQVHPELFSRYNIATVPTVVVAERPTAGCQDDACASRSVAIRGDASLDYILDRVAQRSDGLGKIAKERLKLLQDS